MNIAIAEQRRTGRRLYSRPGAQILMDAAAELGLVLLIILPLLGGFWT